MSIIERGPRDGYGYGIIRVPRLATLDIEPLASIEQTDVQGYLRDKGVFEQIKRELLLPDDYTIMGIYFEVYRDTWCILVEAPGVPAPPEGEMLPVLTPTYQCHPNGENTLLSIDMAIDPYQVARVV